MKCLLFIPIMFFSLDLVAQRVPVVTNFTANEFLYNPAVAGVRDSLCATGLYRNPLFKGPDEEGWPTTAYTSFYAQVGHRFGAGMHAVIHQEGFVRTIASYISGAYHFRLNPTIDFGIGIRGGVLQETLDSKWRPKDPLDKRLPSTSAKPAFDGALGFRFTGNNWSAGVSSLNVTESKMRWGTINFTRKRRYCLTAGYNWSSLVGGRLEIAPAALYVTDLATRHLGANLLATYKKSIYAGLGYSSTDLNTLSLMAGVYIQKKFCIGYAYGIVSPTATGFGSHEIMLQFIQDLKGFK